MKRIVLFITALLLFAGCAKEQLVEERSYTGPVTVVSATFESLSNGATKADVNDAGTFTWQDGDKAAFTAASGSSYYTGTNSSTSATANFTIYDAPTFTSSSFAFYPSDLTTGKSTSSLDVTVPATREWVKDQTNVAMYGVKVENEASFNFRHMGGLVRVRVNNVPTNARKFVFKTPDYKISGDFTAVEESGFKVIKTKKHETENPVPEIEQTYTLTWTTAPDAENTMDFYIPLPLGTYANGFAFKFLDGTGAEILSKTSSLSETIARKDLVLMPAITLMGGEIETAEKAAVVANIPAGYSGDYLLPQSEKVILKINASDSDKDITLKYDEASIPTNLEVKVVDGDNAGNYNAKLLGTLPYTHVKFTQGNIDHTELTTSSSTLAVIYPATIGTLTVMGGNVVLQGATVNMIEVAEGAVADASSSAPVEIKMEKYTPTATGSTEQTPKVTGSVVAKANVQVAPVAGETVTVVKVGTVNVEDTGEGTVKQENGEVSVSTFKDFKNAVDKVVAGQTIKVAATISDAQGITVAEGKQFTVDFGGFTYTCASNPAGSDGTKNQVFQLLQNSTITFKNGTIDVAVAAKENFRFIIQNYANLTLEDITLDGSNLAISDGRVNYTVSNNSGSVEFKGKTNIKAADTKGVAFDAWDDPSYDGVPQVTVNTTGTIEGQVEVTGGTLVVEAGTFKTTGARRSSTANHQSPTLLVTSGNVTVNGGSFTSEHDVAVRAEGGTVTLNNGTFTAPEGAVCFPGAGATINIVGGTYTASDNAVLIGQGSAKDGDANTVNISGGTFTGNISSSGYIACGIYAPWKDNITVTGGTFNITNGAGVVARAGVVTINGGTFNCTGTTTGKVGDKDVSLPCECLIFDDSDPNYPAKDANSKIVVNGGTFSDLSGVNYVANNATYTLGADVTNAAGMAIDTKKTFTVDFNNHIYTVNKPGAGSTNTQTSAFQLLKDQTITFKNGKIQAAEANLNATATDGKSPIKRFIQNYANLTLTNMTLDGTNINDNYSVVEFCNGTVTIDGSTNFTAKSGVASINVDSWKGAYPGGTAVTINTTGNVGKIHCYTEGTGSMTTKSSLTIKNGKNITIDDVSNGEVVISIEGGEFTDMSGVNKVADNGTYKLASDVNLGENILEINSGKAFSIDLNGKTLTGRTNIKHGNVTFKNGNINGGNQQALNVYGSSESTVTNYSVVTVDSDAIVTAEVFGVCLFGPTAGSFEGYGAGVDIKGTVSTTNSTSSAAGAVFVSGNLGETKDANTQTTMEGKNFVNVSGTVTSASDAALALHGSATATITGNLTGNTGIAAKRGKLIVKDNAVITGNGACVGNPTRNGDGTELTGSAVSASSTYGQRLTIGLQGGTYTSAAYTILNNADDAACSFTISGGKYETTKAVDGIAVYARLGSVNITGGEFTNNSNSEATLHVGCPAAVTNGHQPKLTISGEKTVVKNNATGDYPYKSGWKALTVNMANELTYKAVEISGGTFHGQKPESDDSYTEGQEYKKFLVEGYKFSGDATNGWTVSE